MPDEQSDELIERVTAELRKPVTLRPDFDARVMSEVRQAPSRGMGRVLRWLTNPRHVDISPLTGLAAACVLVLAFWAALAPGRGKSSMVAPDSVERTAAGESAAVLEVVRFVLVTPGASAVTLVGDFNGWDTGSTPLRPVGTAGVWSVEVPLAHGVHEYAFVIDGREWRADPAAPRAAVTDFESPNSVVVVGAHES
jgi:hypothetical protein